MTIVSVDLPSSLLHELNEMVGAGGFSSRSEAIRAALKEFLSRRKWLRDLKGSFLATLMFTYVKGGVKGDYLELIKHEFDDVIAADVHTHLEEDSCFEVLVLKGGGWRIRELADKLSALKGVERVEMTIIPLRIKSDAA